MRLLKTKVRSFTPLKLDLEDFSDREVPLYAILSHTWGLEEVLFSHICNDTALKRKGVGKLLHAVSQAHQDGFDYIWIDTCCIDKGSSAELSEAINSMYTWYSEAAKCYVYLADVPADVELSADDSEFARSRWFTRGWCLQELLAPEDLVFLSKDWLEIGDKHSLADVLTEITQIDLEILTGERPLDSVSVAKRMSWAANRETTRIEDMAYCLMGIFSVHMPMLYGEGKRAFQRLQEEIMKYSDDQSLFAWIDPNIPPDRPHGLLADSPAAFTSSGDVVYYPHHDEQSTFEMTNQGLRIDLRIDTKTDDIYSAAINCTSPTLGYSYFLGIHLKKLRSGKNQFVRVHCQQLGAHDLDGRLQTVYIQQRVSPTETHTKAPSHLLLLQETALISRHYCVLDVIGLVSHAEEKKRRHGHSLKTHFPSHFKLLECAGSLSAAILFRRESDGEMLVVMLGTGAHENIGFEVRNHYDEALDGLPNMQQIFHPQSTHAPQELDHHRVYVNVKRWNKFNTTIHKVSIMIEPIVMEKVYPIILPLSCPSPDLIPGSHRCMTPDWIEGVRSKLGFESPTLGCLDESF